MKRILLLAMLIAVSPVFAKDVKFEKVDSETIKRTETNVEENNLSRVDIEICVTGEQAKIEASQALINMYGIRKSKKKSYIDQKYDKLIIKEQENISKSQQKIADCSETLTNMDNLEIALAPKKMDSETKLAFDLIIGVLPKEETNVAKK